MNNQNEVNINHCGRCCISCENLDDKSKRQSSCTDISHPCDNSKNCAIIKCTEFTKYLNCSLCLRLTQKGELCKLLQERKISLIDVYRFFYPKKYVEAVFHYEYHNSSGQSISIENEAISLVSISDFLDHFYCVHGDDQSFNNVLALPPQSHCVILTGPLGSGKTTYLTKLSLNDDIRTISIDFTKYAKEDIPYESDRSSIYLFYDKMVKNAVLSAFRKTLSDNLDSSFTYKGDRKENKYQISRFSTLREFIFYFLTLTTDSATHYLNINQIEKNSIELYISNLKDEELNDIFTEKIAVYDTLFIYATLLQKLFSNVECILLIFDNIDEIDILKSGLFSSSYLFHTNSQLSQKALDFDVTIYKEYKWLSVLSIRYENLIFVEDSKAQFANTKVVITLDDSFKRALIKQKYDNITCVFNTSQEMSTFFKLVAEKRINFLDGKLANDDNINDFYSRFKLVAMNIQSSGLHQFSGIDIVRLCNNSVKLYLRLIFRVSNAFAVSNDEVLLDPFERDVIETLLWKSLLVESEDQIFNLFLDDLDHSRERNGECEKHRMLLTYLYNRISKSTTFDDIITDFRLLPLGKTDSAKNELKSVVHGLSQKGIYGYNLLSLIQDNRIDSSADISDNCIIFLEPRGVIFIEKILITYDFFIADICRNENRIEDFKSIYYMTLDESLSVITKVVESVKTLSSKYEEYFRSMELAWEGTQDNVHKYVDKFMYKKTFYINRIASSHISSIKRYITHILINGDRIKIKDCNNIEAILICEEQLRLLTTSIKSLNVNLKNDITDEALSSLAKKTSEDKDIDTNIKDNIVQLDYAVSEYKKLERRWKEIFRLILE